MPSTAVKPQHSHLMELFSCQEPAASPGNNQGKLTHLQLQVAVKNCRHLRQSVPADRDAVQSFHRLMGTSCLVVPPQHKASVRDKRKVFSSKQVGGANTEKASLWGRSAVEWGGKEGQRQVSGTFVNTSGRRKRNDVFDLPALYSRSHWVAQRELSPCSRPAAPWGAKKGVFPPSRGVGAAQACGC